MLKKIPSFLKAQDSLEHKMFWSMLLVVTIVSSISVLQTIIEGNNMAALICNTGCTLISILIAVITVKTGLYNQCYLILCCIFSCFLLPLQFLFCGGISSGLPLYFTTSLALIAFAPRSQFKIPAFVISLFMQSLIVVATWHFPQWIVVQLDRNASYLDYIISHLLTGFALFSIGSISLKAYCSEREKSTKLLSQLDYHTVRDSLTGLYNRWHLLSYLEKSVWHNRNDFFIAMFDLDNFKRLNREYGHYFGDEILRSVANLLQKNEDESRGECAARFGGENFIYVIRAESEAEAYAKAETFRKAVSHLTFERHPQVSLSISGSLVECNNRSFTEVRQMLIKLDQLLSVAKEHGKNQIRYMTE